MVANFYIQLTLWKSWPLWDLRLLNKPWKSLKTFIPSNWESLRIVRHIHSWSKLWANAHSFTNSLSAPKNQKNATNYLSALRRSITASIQSHWLLPWKTLEEFNTWIIKSMSQSRHSKEQSTMSTKSSQLIRSKTRTTLSKIQLRLSSS